MFFFNIQIYVYLHIKQKICGRILMSFSKVVIIEFGYNWVWDKSIFI